MRYGRLEMDLSETAKLLERARAGERRAVDAVFERCGSKLLALIRLRLGRELRQRLESRDILQGAMLKAFEGWDQLHSADQLCSPDRPLAASASFMAWLAQIAENEIRDQAVYHRRARRDAKCDVGLEDLTGAAALLAAKVRSATSRLVRDEQAAQLERALEALEADHREVIVLRRFEELSYPDVGRRMGRSPDACRMLYARAMTALVAEMESN